MRRSLLYIFIAALLLPGCAVFPGNTTRVVKPKYHHRWFHGKKDKKVKRTRVVRMKS